MGQSDQLVNSRRFRMEVAIAAAVTVIWTLWLRFEWGGPDVTLGIADFGLFVPAAFASVAAGLTARRAPRHTRVVWMLLAGSMASFGIAELLWSWFEVVLVSDPFPSFADVGYILGGLLAIAAVVAIPRDGHSRSSRLRTVMDGVILAGALLFISWAVLIGDIVTSIGGGPALERFVVMTYPMLDVVSITVVVLALGHSRVSAPFSRTSLWFLGAGLMALALADSAFAYTELKGNFVSGGLLDGAWFASYAFIFLAARTPSAIVDRRPADVAVHSRAGLVAPYIALLGAAAAAVGMQAAGGIPGGMIWIAIGLGVAVMIRHSMAMTENVFLLRSLETRVAARTVALERSEQRFSSLVSNSSDIILIVDRDNIVTFVTPSVARVLGYEQDEVHGEPITKVVRGYDQDRLLSLLEATAHGDRTQLRKGVFEVRHGDGRWRQIEVSAVNLLDDPNVQGVVLNSRDVSEQHALQLQLTHNVFHDPLTRLANRALFRDRVTHALAAAKRGGGKSPAVLTLDIDGFKAVNDRFGHTVGDEVLNRVAARLNDAVRPGDTVARLGGDQFAILLEDTDEFEGLEAAQRMVTTVQQPLAFSGHEITLTVSVGVTPVSGEESSADEVLRRAEVVLYRAKAAPGHSVFRYRPEEPDEGIAQATLALDLKHALPRQELILEYQPIYELGTTTMTGCEALLRWIHPERGTVPPLDFIPLAEQSGLIDPIGKWVLETACREIQELPPRRVDGRPVSIAVNVSAVQLQRADYADEVADVLERTGLPPGRLVLEVTETVLVENVNSATEILERLRSLGVRIAIDDFGTGYSSLAYLHSLPIDILKIDRSFVARLGQPERDAELVRVMLALANTLNLKVVAEGAEEAEHVEHLRSMGCSHAQGFHLARPMPLKRLFDQPSLKQYDDMITDDDILVIA